MLQVYAGSSHMSQRDWRCLRSSRMQVPSLARHSGVKDWHCHSCGVGRNWLESDPWPRNSICHRTAKNIYIYYYILYIYAHTHSVKIKVQINFSFSPLKKTSLFPSIRWNTVYNLLLFPCCRDSQLSWF